jgi:hypothetical protein
MQGEGAMYYTKAVTAAVVLLVGGLTWAQEWIEYVERAQRFSVNFPREPETRDIDYVSERGAVFPARVFSVQNGPSYYAITVVDFTEPGKYDEPTDKTDDTSTERLWILDQRASVAQAARHFRQRGGEVTFDAWHDIDRVEGHMLQITNADESRTFAGIYLHASRLYILEAAVPKGSPPPGMFQQSLSFLDEAGNRVRYDLAADGSRTRIR